MKKSILQTIFLCVFSALIINTSYSQSLFTYHTPGTSGFTPSELAMVDTFALDTATYDSVMIVEVADIWSIQEDGYFDVNLPGEPTLKADVFNYDMADHTNPDDEYYIEGWFYGMLENDEGTEELDYDGDIQLSKKDDIIIGSIRPFNSDRLYRVMSIETGKHILMRYNATWVSSHSTCVPLDPPNTPAQKINSPCDREIRVLVLYSTKVKDKYTNAAIQGHARAQVQLLNGAVYNSTYGNMQGLNFKLVATEHIGTSYFDETLNGDDNDAITDISLLAVSSHAQFRKSFHQADLVVCLTDAKYQNISGLAQDIGVSPNIAYALVEMDAPLNEYVLAHEVGHLMGARHQQSHITIINGANPDNTPGYEHGYRIEKGFVFKKSYKSIMHNQAKQISDHVFSSPSLVWRNKIYGVVNENDVVRHLYDYACAVADYVNGPAPFFTATSTGPFIAGTNQSISIVGTPFYGYPPYEYKWYLSTDGGSSYSLISQQNSVSYQGSVTFNMPNSPKALVYMFVTDNVNQAKGVYRTVHNTRIAYGDYPDVEHCCPVFETDAPKPAGVASVNEDAQSTITIVPNPANDYTNIQTSIPAKYFSGSFTVSISDVTGKVLESRDVYTANDVWHLSTGGLASGVYLITLKGNSLNITEKLLISK